MAITKDEAQLMVDKHWEIKDIPGRAWVSFAHKGGNGRVVEVPKFARHILTRFLRIVSYHSDEGP